MRPDALEVQYTWNDQWAFPVAWIDHRVVSLENFAFLCLNYEA